MTTYTAVERRVWAKCRATSETGCWGCVCPECAAMRIEASRADAEGWEWMDTRDAERAMIREERDDLVAAARRDGELTRYEFEEER